MNSKRCYVLFCDEKYYYLMRNILTLLQTFSEHKVLAYTINFLPTDSFKNVIWKRINDYNLLEYQATGKNNLIKNEWDKTMYSCMLKASATKESLETDFDEFIYMDIDMWPTKRIDDSFLAVKQRGLTHPILLQSYWQYQMFGGKGNPFTEEGGVTTVDESKTLEWWLIKRLGLEENHERQWYRQAGFFYYDKNSKPFWEEAHAILSDEDIFRDHDKFFGDESVLNVLLWKYKAAEYFESKRMINIAGGNRLDSIDKIDSFFKELNTESGPEFVNYWYGKAHLNDAWMIHGKVYLYMWKERLLGKHTGPEHKVYSDKEQTARFNNYFIDKMFQLD